MNVEEKASEVIAKWKAGDPNRTAGLFITDLLHLHELIRDAIAASRPPKDHIIDETGAVESGSQEKRDYGCCVVEPGVWPGHDGPVGQAMGVPLTADGVPMYRGMPVWDRNGEAFTVVDVWSTCEGVPNGWPRFYVRCEFACKDGRIIHKPRWGNAFSSAAAAEAARGAEG